MVAEPRSSNLTAETMTGRVGILIVEKRLRYREILRRMLDHAGANGVAVLGEATSDDDAVDQVAKLHPQVVLLDIASASESAASLVLRIRGAHTETRVLIVLDEEPGELAPELVEAGAFGYVTWHVSVLGMAAAIRAVSEWPTSGTDVATPYLGRLPYDELSPSPPLSDREREILQLLANGSTTREVARMLNISMVSLGERVKAIFSKLRLLDHTPDPPSPA